jgi:hypothetical protein
LFDFEESWIESVAIIHCQGKNWAVNAADSIDLCKATFGLFILFEHHDGAKIVL